MKEKNDYKWLAPIIIGNIIPIIGLFLLGWKSSQVVLAYILELSAYVLVGVAKTVQCAIQGKMYEERFGWLDALTVSMVLVGVAGSSIVIGAVVLNYFDTKTIDTGPSPLSGTGYFDRAASVAIFLINYAISNPLVVIIFLFYVAAAINDYFYAKTQPLLKVHAEMARVMDRVLLFWIAFIFSMAAVVFSLAGPGLVFICARVVLDTLIAKKRTLMK